VHAYGPTNRNLRNLARNAILAWRIVRDVRPSAIVTTGAGVAVPFAWVARLRRIPVVYIESFTRIEEPSLSLRLIRPAASRVYVQWPELAQRVRGARYVGSILGTPR
jgi:UDP-N-acetylglucosamine:LPS N-acetylglucosamine transferase